MEHDKVPEESSNMNELNIFSIDFSVPQNELFQLDMEPLYSPYDVSSSSKSEDDLRVSQERNSKSVTGENKAEENRPEQLRTTEATREKSEFLDKNGLFSGTILDMREYNGCGYKEVSVKNPLNCNLCNKKFLYREAFFKHMERAHFEKKQSEVLQCKECSAGFPSRRRLFLHTKAAHNRSSIKEICSICGAQFSTLNSYTIHKRITHQIEPEYRRKLKKYRQSSESVEKDGLRVCICDKCGYVAESQGLIEMHIDITHFNKQDAKRLSCA